MLKTGRCISIFGQIVATVPFYTRAYFDMGQYNIPVVEYGKFFRQPRKIEVISLPGKSKSPDPGISIQVYKYNK